MKNFRICFTIFLVISFIAVQNSYAKSYPGIVGVLTERAMQHVEDGNITEAAHDFEKVLLADQNNATARDYLGRVEFQEALSPSFAEKNKLKNKVTHLQQKVALLNNTQKIHNRHNRNLAVEKDLLRSQSYKKDIQMAKLKQDINELDAYLNSPEVQIDRLTLQFLGQAAYIHKERAKVLEQDRDQAEEARDRIAREMLEKDVFYQKQIAGLRAQVKQGVEKLVSLNMDLTVKDGEIGDLQDSIVSIKEEMAALNESIVPMVQKVKKDIRQEQQDGVVNLQLEFEEMKGALQSRLEELKVKNQKIRELNAQLADLDARRSVEVQAMAKAEAARKSEKLAGLYKEEITGLKDSLLEKNKQVSRLDDDLAVVKTQMAERDKTVKDQKKFISQLQEEVEQLESQVNESQEVFAKEKSSLDKKLAKTEDLLDKSSALIKVRDEEIRKLKSQIVSIQKDGSLSKKDELAMGELRDELLNTKSRLDSSLELLEKKNKEVTQLSAQLDSLEKKLALKAATSSPPEVVSSKKEEIASLNDRLKVLQGQLYESQAAIEDQEEIIRALENEITQAEDIKNSKGDDKVAWLQKELDDMRDHFQSSIKLLDEREKMIKSLRGEVAQLKDQKNALADEQSRVINLRNQIEDAKVRLFELQLALEQKDKDIASLEGSFKDVEERLQLAQRLIVKKDEQIKMLQESLKGFLEESKK